MPRTQVWLYRTADGEAPVRDWLRALRSRDREAYERCVVALHRLAAAGWELRRPHVDYLRDAIHELRVRSRRVRLRILYFCLGRDAVVLATALAKTDVVPDAEIERALARRAATLAEPDVHLLKEWAVDER